MFVIAGGRYRLQRACYITARNFHPLPIHHPSLSLLIHSTPADDFPASAARISSVPTFVKCASSSPEGCVDLMDVGVADGTRCCNRGAHSLEFDDGSSSWCAASDRGYARFKTAARKYDLQAEYKCLLVRREREG